MVIDSDDDEDASMEVDVAPRAARTARGAATKAKGAFIELDLSDGEASEASVHSESEDEED